MMTVEQQLEACRAAILHVLDRSQDNPDLGWLIGPGMQSFELLCAAEAALSSEDPKRLRARRAKDLQPEYRRRRAEVLELRDKVYKLEAALDELRGANRDDIFALGNAAERALNQLERDV